MDQRYSKFRERLSQALDPQLYPVEYLDALIGTGRALFDCTESAAIVFDTKRYPSGRLDVHGLVAAGEAQAIVKRLIPRAEEWGRRNGCHGALIESRPGWARILKHHGYEPHQLAVRKEF